MSETIYSVVNDKVVLGLHLVEDGASVIGQSPTVELRRLRDGRYFDFAAVAAPFWKTTGGSKEQSLAAKSYLPGLYTHTWDQSIYDPDAREQYVAIYRNTDPDYLVEIVEFHHFTFEWEAVITYMRKLMENNSFVEMLSDTQVRHTWFDDDGTTPLLKHKLTKSGAFETREKEP